MGMDAVVLAIGPWGAFNGDDLDYDVESYRDSVTSGDERIICIAAQANTTRQSHDLATICCTEAWALGRHQVKRVTLPDTISRYDWIGGEKVGTVLGRLQRLLDCGCELWFRPEG